MGVVFTGVSFRQTGVWPSGGLESNWRAESRCRAVATPISIGRVPFCLRRRGRCTDGLPPGAPAGQNRVNHDVRLTCQSAASNQTKGAKRMIRTLVGLLFLTVVVLAAQVPSTN